MKNISGNSRLKIATFGVALFMAGAVVSAQFKIGELLKIAGVGVVVSKFGPQINKELNKVAHTPDSPNNISKVVPILTGGINGRTAIGAAQVRGTRAQVNKVNAVAQLDQNIFGELKARIMIPIASKNVIQNLKPVPGVGVTGILDLRVRF